MNEMRKLMEAIEEANQGGKTEHSGAKHGKGAYYGRKKEAKRDSNKNRRNAGKSQSKEISEVTTEDGVTYSLGTVEVTVFDDEISLKHGHGQNIFLSREEFSDFIRGIAHNGLNEAGLLRRAGSNRTLRKYVPKLGKHEADERAEDHFFHGRMFRDAEYGTGDGDGAELSPEDQAEKSRAYRTGNRFSKISQGRAPFREEGIEEDFNARESTVALHELMDEGILDARTVADACLNYMSEAEVDDMAGDNSFFGDE